MRSRLLGVSAASATGSFRRSAAELLGRLRRSNLHPSFWMGAAAVPSSTQQLAPPYHHRPSSSFPYSHDGRRRRRRPRCFFSTNTVRKPPPPSQQQQQGAAAAPAAAAVFQFARRRSRQQQPPPPQLQLGTGRLARLARASVVGQCGGTTVLVTVAAANGSSNSSSSHAAAVADSSSSSSNAAFLTVDYRQKAAAAGRIPALNRLRHDSRLPSPPEVVAARAVDRALRPLLLRRRSNGNDNSNGNNGNVSNNRTAAAAAQPQQHYHVHAVVQAADRGAPNNGSSNSSSSSSSNSIQYYWKGHAVATALNAASAALQEQLGQPVAAVCLGVTAAAGHEQQQQQGGARTLTLHEGPHTSSSANDAPSVPVGELLYAGTPDGRAVALEWTAHTGSLPERDLARLVEIAAAALRPAFDTLREFRKLPQQQPARRTRCGSSSGAATDATTATSDSGENNNADEDDETNRIRASLGLPPLETATATATATTSEAEHGTDDSSSLSKEKNHQQQELLLEGAVSYCRERLGDALLRLFGYSRGGSDNQPVLPQDAAATSLKSVSVHRGDQQLLSKQVRGRREQILQEEIARLVDEYLENNVKYNDNVDDVCGNSEADENNCLSLSISSWIHQQTVVRLLRQALWETTRKYGTRADGRGGGGNHGWKTVRPIATAVPALPPTVHGSALFARGDTQVLCTVTLGAPSEGPPLDPLHPSTVLPKNGNGAEEEIDSDHDATASPDQLPVGSLRFLRTQEALVSDLNSRQSKADKERTGDSGSLADCQRAWLQYDFPAYATGEVPAARGGGLDRRAIGHGALAERALLPVLPDQDVFPYSIRMTSEVTDSNGSSSMASVCGVTLALLDAGVPLKAPVAGVSVGLAARLEEDDDGNADDKVDDNYSLLLDITGTEDHYGAMDFKIAGTRNGVTAAQLDVKQPLPLEVLVRALDLAKHGRAAILETMSEQTAHGPVGPALNCRPEPKPTAPRVEVVRFDPNRKRDLVGPGGVVLRQLEERYGVSLDLTQEGQCLLFGTDREMVKKAKMTVMELVADVVEEEVYTGTVIETKDFGAVLELLRNKEGLLHVSEMTNNSNNDAYDDPRTHPEGTAGFVQQHLKVGQKIDVLCIGVDPLHGSVKLSQKALVRKKEKETHQADAM